MLHKEGVLLDEEGAEEYLRLEDVFICPFVPATEGDLPHINFSAYSCNKDIATGRTILSTCATVLRLWYDDMIVYEVSDKYLFIVKGEAHVKPT